MQHEEGALVLFSGGQDSTTCLAWALSRFRPVETLGFDYRQRHAIELQCRGPIREAIRAALPDLARGLREDHIVDLGILGTISETALTRDVEIAMLANGLPSTFVPGRNILFLTFAACIAYRRGLKHIVGGMCETDFSGYPDCRDDTVKSLQATLNLGMAAHFVLHTPLMWLDKSETWSLAEKLGGEALLELILELTHSCYLGERGERHDWGYGCGKCPACELRSAGFARYQRQKQA
ncbi:MAG TPA: 7-cyano-7-deazaguanine synthase QueC [Stellaceae bacterium]|nr:7-cyano-7-deazaguanine synthase QueC [Stellaceae bacterium]